MSSTVFSWNQADFEKLIANCPDEPVTPYIFKYFPVGSRLLEAGCGSGRFVYWLTEQGYDVTGLELGAETVATLHRLYPHLQIDEGNVCALPYANDSFAGILSLGVIEHVVAGMTVPIREMYRVLQPGGVALVIVPSYNRVRQIKFWTGIYHLRALLGLIKHSRWLRRLAGRPAGPTAAPVSTVAGRRPAFKRWPMFGPFFEYRLRKEEFEAELTREGFQLIESVPTSLIDGLYLEFGRPFVRFANLTFYPNTAGRWLNAWLSRRPFWHNHMHLCVVRKPGTGA